MVTTCILIVKMSHVTFYIRFLITYVKATRLNVFHTILDDAREEANVFFPFMSFVSNFVMGSKTLIACDIST